MKFKLNGYMMVNSSEIYLDNMEVELLDDTTNNNLDDTSEFDSNNRLLSFDEVMDFDDYEECDCEFCSGLDEDYYIDLDNIDPDTVLDVAGIQFTVRELEENPDLFDEIQAKVVDMHADMIADAKDIHEIKEILEELISYFTE